ncbi:phosphatase PAP2 family protein [Streptomyces sp. A3M-1-3]|uniref:phosphatase PAP2 family protein n=1 Tax=Streptomyces sp. A3M-1-3 TaxID=2962044 RepID=UPI0020B76AC6|nr:phosphatase PAP2 family protein [Streptomyces sp. A3M-1-3]MCP3816654.1 phosphatase PAP2 family protein [Streptomyces sp. A3M-1-3]
MRETPRPQGTAGEAGPELPQLRPGCAFAHTNGASSSGSPHRSDGRPPQTPRGARHTDPGGRLGTTPPVPGRPASSFPTRFTGRSAPARLFALCAVLFALVTWQVAARGPLRAADERLGRGLFLRGPDRLAEFCADLGSTFVAGPVLAAVIAYTFWRGRRWRPTLAAALAMAAVPALVIPLKAWIARTGPLAPGTGWYPSGHTATATVAYCAAALLLAPYVRPRVRVRLMPAALVLSTATGIGLVLRGYHWPLDVLGSWCLSVPILLLSFRSTCRRSSRTPTDHG